MPTSVRPESREGLQVRDREDLHLHGMVREALGSNTSGAIDDLSPVCRYVIVRSDGRVVKVGTAPDPKNGVYTINLADGLGAGAYTAFVTVYLNDNYMTPDVKAVPFRN